MSPIQFSGTSPEQIRKRVEETDAEQRFRSGVYWRAIALLVGCTALGLAGMALGLMSTSAVWGPILFWLGVLAADVGFGAALVWAYRQLER